MEMVVAAVANLTVTFADVPVVVHVAPPRLCWEGVGGVGQVKAVLPQGVPNERGGCRVV